MFACAALALLFAGAAPAQDVPDPFDASREALMAAETPAEAVEVLRAFLADHPDHPQAPRAASTAVDVLLGLLDDRDGAIALLEQQIPRTKDAAARDQLRLVLVRALGAPDHAEALAALVSEHLDPAALAFGEQVDVMEAAAAAGAGELLARTAEAALPSATAEAFAADYPDREFTAAQLAERADNRRGMVLTFQGRAAALAGDPDAALATFARADELLATGLLGVPDNALYRYWGEALLDVGRAEPGLRKLVVAEAFAADAEAGDLAREHHETLAAGGSFEQFAWSVRRDAAPQVPAFAARGYDGESRAFTDLQGEKATLLAFWFPT
jgi:hypothetical protein